ncbi:LysR family transcriptional regulator [Pseudorhodoferax sp. Leaf274]|uniref:LysR family transcriptional regulator n=1 Tax=Pseudorhodoferax sp. Leaf274 TaxID=1736318 RepID=UPI00070309A5|nr:LysR family transcriptional regulator [Pseudorhodoferax sp. Leaf274]KQP44596.1 LysR family transcriptional regulator [Pseudorhodoferax sp. Leaf274]
MESIKFAENLAMFVDVAQAGSFSAVARRKGLVASSVARQIGALEQDLQVTLFTRSTRALVLTDAGSLLFDRAVRILHDMRAVRSEVVAAEQTVQGLLRVSCVPAFGRRHVVPHLGSLAEKHPGLRVELELTERAVDVVVERVDLVIRLGQQPDSSLVGQRIGYQRYIIGAAPAYLQRHGHPRRFDELAQHRLIDRQHSTSTRGWREISGAQAWLPEQFAFECDDCDARRLSAAQGLGIALMPNWAIGEDLAAGRLVALDLQGAPPLEATGIYLLRAAARANSKTRAFTQHLIDSIGRSASWVQDAETAMPA